MFVWDGVGGRGEGAPFLGVSNFAYAMCAIFRADE